MNIYLAGRDQPIQVTPGHRIWSLDRHGWTTAGELVGGERLATGAGSAVVASVAYDSGAQPVYNLDVEGDHRYLVGELHVLAHNADGLCGPKFKANFGSKIKTKLNQLRKKYPSVRKASDGGIDDAREIATQVFNAGGGREGPPVGNDAPSALYFDDGPVTWVFKPDGEFWSMRANGGWDG